MGSCKRRRIHNARIWISSVALRCASNIRRCRCPLVPAAFKCPLCRSLSPARPRTPRGICVPPMPVCWSPWTSRAASPFGPTRPGGRSPRGLCDATHRQSGIPRQCDRVSCLLFLSGNTTQRKLPLHHHDPDNTGARPYNPFMAESVPRSTPPPTLSASSTTQSRPPATAIVRRGRRPPEPADCHRPHPHRRPPGRRLPPRNPGLMPFLNTRRII